MKALEALKRIRQETYNPDFDKLKCCDIIEDALIVLQIIYDKHIDLDYVIESKNYDDYVKKMDEWFSKNTVKGTIKYKWFELYVLDEDEYNLVRNMI